MKKEMLINVLQPEECRIAIVEDGILEELYVERTSHESYTGNIYKGRVVNLEPAIQAAFVDFSVGRNGFLHVSDVEPQYYSKHDEDDADAPPPPPAPRSRDPRPARPEDRDRPARPASPPYRDPEDRFRERERPDRSEKGQRDRSPRRFGEGLVEEWETPPPPAPRPAPPAATPPPAAREPVARVEPPPREAVEEEPLSWSREDAPRARSGRTSPPAPTPPSESSIESELPPSRTARSRPAPTPAPRSPEPVIEAEDEPIESFRPRRPAASSRPVAPAPPPVPEFEPEPPSEPEPRRGWGRGRAPARPAAPEPTPPPIADEPDLYAPTADPEPDLGDTPPRRGGRAAIRSRGGEREPARPRERPRMREPEPELDLEAERLREFAQDLLQPSSEPLPPAPAPRARAAEPEPRAPRGRGRSDRPRTPEPEGGRVAPHDRAGEPGYVPRHKRLSAGETALPAEPPASLGWRDPDLDDPLAADLDADLDAEGGPGEATERAPDGTKRRRRRRGRRRDRTDREVEAKVGGLPADEDLDDFDDDLEPAPAPVPAPRSAPAARREPPPRRAEGTRVDRDPAEDLPRSRDFDFDDEFDEHDEDFAASADIDDLPPAELVDDEIDPELEEEIRREIEEITELEREMGLRGTTEARPRRGDSPAGGPRAPRGRGVTKPPLQDIFRRGDEVLVQVIKESIGTKGPTLSTYISIPGRYLVLMPGLARVGVSRKIADEGQRRRLREIMTALNPPKGLGFIVRTAGLDRTKKELARDLAYLLRLWKVILKRIKKAKAPAPIYQESDMITRTIRDIFNSEIDTIWIDEPQAFERAQEFLRVVMPKFVNRLKFYDDKVPMFHKYGLEEEIVKIQRRRVEMPEGGSIVIDPTEALVAIDVNSGNFRVENDAERTAYEMNLRAAKEIARQLRLRDLGGVICNDFIDMRDEKNRRGVEKALRDAIKRDRARTKILRMSQFGVIEMTRQRIRPSLKRSVYEDCPECSGAGVVKTVESMSIDVMRLLALAAHREDIRRVNITVNPDVATYLNNRKRKEIARFESEGNVMVYIHPEPNAPREHLQLDCFDAQNGEVRLLPAPPPPPRRGR